MSLIPDLPTTNSPALSDFMITDNGSTTQKVTIENLKEAMGVGVNTFSFQINAGTSRTFTVANNSRLVFFCISTATALRGLYIAAASSSGAVGVTNVQAASSISVTTATNAITFANNATSGTLFVCGLIYNGSIG